MKTHLVICCFFLSFISSRSFAQDYEKVPYVPSPIEVVDRMLEFADVRKGDVVFDIGSGDGRVVIQAAKKYGAPEPSGRAWITWWSSNREMPSRPIYRQPR